MATARTFKSSKDINLNLGNKNINIRWQLQAPAYGFPIKLTRDPNV